jgi:hypothetical protein
MPQAIFEVTGKFESESSAQKLVYAPLSAPLTYRETQCYKVEYEGAGEELETFVRKVLLDPISQSLTVGGVPLWPAKFILEYGMKAAALDLEKETILEYLRGLSDPGFSVTKLTLRRRVYVFGEGAEPEPFVRDMVNPAIHSSELISSEE